MSLHNVHLPATVSPLSSPFLCVRQRYETACHGNQYGGKHREEDHRSKSVSSAHRHESGPLQLAHPLISSPFLFLRRPPLPHILILSSRPQRPPQVIGDFKTTTCVLLSLLLQTHLRRAEFTKMLTGRVQSDCIFYI